MHSLETIQKSIFALTSKTIRLEARCDALEGALGVLALKCGIPDAQLRAALDAAFAECHQKRLERVENIDPWIAATVDCRPLMPGGPTLPPLGPD